jgi:hypothetical protein
MVNHSTIKKNKETLFGASNKVDLEVNAGKTKYMLLSCPRMQDKSMIQRQLTDPLKMWQS